MASFQPAETSWKDGIRSRLLEHLCQRLQLSSSSCTADVVIGLQDALALLETGHMLQTLQFDQNTRQNSISIQEVLPVPSMCMW